jgi:hypothetical protein
MPHTAASLLPDMSGLSDSGAWGGIVILAASTPIAAAWAWLLLRRSAVRQEATRRRHAQLLETAILQDAAPVSQTTEATRRRARAKWRQRITAANKGRW